MFFKKAVLLLLLSLLSIYLVACGGLARVDYISSLAMFSNNELRVKLNCRAYYDGYYTYFRVEKNINELVEIIQEQYPEAILSLSGTACYIQLKQTDGTIDNYYLQELNPSKLREDLYEYNLNSMRADFVYKTFDRYSETVKFSDYSIEILIPSFIIWDARLSTQIPCLYADISYQTIGSYNSEGIRKDFEKGKNVIEKEFYDFYLESGWYEVKQHQEGFTITRDDVTILFTFTEHLGCVYLLLNVIDF